MTVRDPAGQALVASDEARSDLHPTGFDPSRVCECIDSNGDQWLPMYGCAPHECYWRKGPEFTLGQSTLVPFSSDDCFVPELDCGEGWEAFVYPYACGVFFCPECQQDEYRAAWQRLVDRVGEPPAEVGSGHHG